MPEGQAPIRHDGRGEGRARRPRRGCQRPLLTGLALLLLAGGAAADPCKPWPGEPQPLPRVDEPDEMRARWASLRASELATLARAFEATAPVIAHRLWRRVLCLDPAADRAVAGLAATPLVVVHQPVVVRGGAPELAPDPWAGLGSPLALRAVPTPTATPTPTPTATPTATAPAATPTGATPTPDRFASALAAAQAHLQAARFEEALAAARAAREQADRAGTSVDPERRAALEVVAATAAIALGRDAEAEASFVRALEAEPDLTLDPVRTPPKVRRSLDRVRAERTP